MQLGRENIKNKRNENAHGIWFKFKKTNTFYIYRCKNKWYRRSENAVKLQICIALTAYLLIQKVEELKEYMSEVCKYFTESKFIKLINNNIFKTLRPRKYGKNARDNPWQLTFEFRTWFYCL